MPAKRASKGAEAIAGDTRGRIISAALGLLTTGGRDAVTTRAVADAAGVQPPVLYRQFKDKGGLLDAVAEYGFMRYLERKQRRSPQLEPIDSLRAGWDQHIEFGLQQPMIYLLMYAEPTPGRTSAAAARSFEMLREHVARVAAAGLLRVTEEQAVSLYHSAAMGVVLFLLSSPTDTRDLTISSMAREASLTAITGMSNQASARSPGSSAAVTLRATLDGDSPFSATELALLREWLGRIAK